MDAGTEAATPATPATPEATCSAYVACTAATTPEGLGVIASTYGRDGTCWSALDAATCAAACKTGLVRTHTAFPKEEACNLCDVHADCPSSLPSCQVTTRQCVQCGTSADCPSTLRACDVMARTCVECTSNADCATRSTTPACDTAKRRCVMCNTNQDCGAQGLSDVCDSASHSCRKCQSDAECPSGVCASGACVACRTSQDCPASASRCTQQGACVGCVDGNDCTSGACNLGTGTCCSAGTCAAQNVQCGFTTDPFGCGFFTEIPCGACPGAENCVEATCKAPPVNNCGTGCGGRCGYVPGSNSYECVTRSSSCNTTTHVACASGFKCVSRKSSFDGMYYDLCEKYCLVDADCGVGSTCESLSGVKGLGTCR